MITIRTPVLLCAVLGLAVVAASSGCSATTAHLSDIKTATDKAMTSPASTFGTKDTIYAQSEVANNGDKVTLKWHVTAEHATGIEPNFKIPGLDVNEDVNGDETSSYSMSAPPAGWPTGTYKIEVDMAYSGQQKNSRTTEFTVQ